MPQFIQPDDIIPQMELLIDQTRETVWFVSPDIHLTEPVFVKLGGASARGVKINIFIGTEPDPLAAQLLSVIQNVELYCLENLNARCYLNEENMLITSMSLGDMQGPVKHDIAILINSTIDSELNNTIRADIDSMVISYVGIGLIPGSGDHTLKADAMYQGFCISCGMPVSYNTENPFCQMCGRSVRTANEDFNGFYCHSCGTEFSVNTPVPLCAECEGKNKNSGV